MPDTEVESVTDVTTLDVADVLDEERQRRTYESAGFAETRDLGPLRAFLRYL